MDGVYSTFEKHAMLQKRYKKGAANTAKLQNMAVLCHASSEKFYSSKEWLLFRVQILDEQGSRCQACGITKNDAILHVDHVKPRSTYPELSFNKENMQVLCETCNVGKMTKTYDFRDRPRRLLEVAECYPFIPDQPAEITLIRRAAVFLFNEIANLNEKEKTALTALGFDKERRKKLYNHLNLLIGVTARVANIVANKEQMKIKSKEQDDDFKKTIRGNT